VGKFIPVEPEKWAEMVKAQAEVARLEALTSEMDKTINASQAECRRLKAEVERLTKAGDDLETWVLILRHNNPTDIEDFRSVVLNWNAAKKGGQP
jgi:predicted  nucleic acid-binding Zn-ribbon protein